MLRIFFLNLIIIFTVNSEFYHYTDIDSFHTLGINKKWELELKKDNSFFMKCKVYDTKYRSEKVEIYFGFWESNNDTLVLKTKSRNILKINYDIKYLKRNNELQRIVFNVWFPKKIKLWQNV